MSDIERSQMHFALGKAYEVKKILINLLKIIMKVTR